MAIRHATINAPAQPTLSGGVFFGVRAIAAVLDLTEAETLNGIKTGRIPAFRMGAGWGASERDLAQAMVLRYARAL